MPLLALCIGILFVGTALNNTTGQMFKLLRSEFVGDGSGKPTFVPWMTAIVAIGSIGFYDKLKPLANAFLALIMVVLVLVNRGFFDQFTSALNLKGYGVGALGNVDSSGPSIWDSNSIAAATAPTSGSSGGFASIFDGSALTGGIGGIVDRVGSTINKVTGQLDNGSFDTIGNAGNAIGQMFGGDTGSAISQISNLLNFGSSSSLVSF